MSSALDYTLVEQLDHALIEAANPAEIVVDPLQSLRFKNDCVHDVPRTAVTFISQMIPGMEKEETPNPVQVG